LEKTKNLQPIKDKWSRIKYVVGLCILLLILFQIDYFIQYIFYVILNIPYDSVFANISRIIIHVAVFVVIIFVGLKDQNKTLASVCYLKRANGMIWFAAIICAVGYTFFSFYLHFLFFSFSYGWDTDLGEIEGNFFFNLIDDAIIPAVFEELQMKGIIFTILRKSFSTVPAVIISSLMFAGLHLNILKFVPLFLLSCYTFWLYLRSGNIIIPMILHFTNNLFSDYLISEPFAELGNFFVALILLFTGTYLLHKSTKNVSDKMSTHKII